MHLPNKIFTEIMLNVLKLNKEKFSIIKRVYFKSRAETNIY